MPAAKKTYRKGPSPALVKARKDIDRLKARNRTLSASKPKKRKTRRRRKPRGLLSQSPLGIIASPAMRGSIKATFSGAVGGAGAAALQKWFGDDLNKLQMYIAKFGLSVVAGAALKMPNVGAGVAGALMQDILRQEAGMGEGMHDHNYVNLDALPPYLNENGYAMSEDQYSLAQSPYDLADNSIYPYQQSYTVPYGGMPQY